MFTSSLAQHITGLINEKRAAGFAYNAASDVLKELDTFCLQNDFSEATVTKELADAWSIQRESEGISARNIRVGILRQVSKYIISLGIDAYLPRHDQSTETKEAHVLRKKSGSLSSRNSIRLLPYADRTERGSCENAVYCSACITAVACVWQSLWK